MIPIKKYKYPQRKQTKKKKIPINQTQHSILFQSIKEQPTTNYNQQCHL